MQTTQKVVLVDINLQANRYALFEWDGTPFGKGKPLIKSTAEHCREYAQLQEMELVSYDDVQRKSYLDKEFNYLANGNI